MKKSKFFVLGLALLMAVASCGPIVVTSRVGSPPPPWFYPNRLEVVRYVYFPDLMVYYDLSAQVYIYLDGGIWVRRSVLPPRYRNTDLRRSRYERIRNYTDDDIRRYHEQNNLNRGRSNRSVRSSNG